MSGQTTLDMCTVDEVRTPQRNRKLNASPAEAREHLRNGGKVRIHGGRADGSVYELADGRLMYQAPVIRLSEQRVSELNHDPEDAWFTSKRIINIELL